MKCPTCEKAALILETRDVKYVYKDSVFTHLRVSAKFCPKCDEYVTDVPTTMRLMQEVLAFKKVVNGKLFDASFIAMARKELGLGQAQAGAIFGGGVNAFSKYETAGSKPPKALIQLLGLLVKHPKLLNEVKKQPVTMRDTSA